MQRLTKAAMATGAAAVLLLGGAGTMAYWTGSATAGSSATLAAGTFTVGSNPACANSWTYVAPGSGSVGTPATNGGIVPGDIVTTTCTFAVTGVGDHIALAGATVSNPVWQNPTTALPTQLGAATITKVTIGSTDYNPDSSGVISETVPLTSGTPTNVTVQIQVTFDYANATDTSQGGIPAALDQITVTFQQGNSVYPTS